MLTVYCIVTIIFVIDPHEPSIHLLTKIGKTWSFKNLFTLPLPTVGPTLYYFVSFDDHVPLIVNIYM